MSDSQDFLYQSWLDVDFQLTDCRDQYNRQHPTAPIPETDIVLLVVMDGIASHKHHHPVFPASHYFEFTMICQQLIRSHHGKVFNVNDSANGVVCGWFSNDGIAGTSAAVAIRQHFVDAALAYRADWPHERHAICALGHHEYAAFRLLQMGRRDSVVVDPTIWQRFSVELQEVLQAVGVLPPDFASRAEAIEQTIQENVDAAQQQLARLRHIEEGLLST